MDKVSGLDTGADDYITKPFDIEELLARIRAALRKRSAKPESASAALSFGALELDPAAHTVTYDGNDIELTNKEFGLLKKLLENKSIVLSRETLLEDVWGFDYMGETNIVDVYIRYIRSKIDDVYGIKMIQTVRGVGYVIRE
jgi:DNA-binding response OmpR family regulator